MRSCSRVPPGDARKRISSANPILVIRTFLSGDPRTASSSVLGLPTRSKLNYRLRSDCGPGFQCQVYHLLVLGLWTSDLVSRRHSFLLCNRMDNHTHLIGML